MLMTRDTLRLFHSRLFTLRTLSIILCCVVFSSQAIALSSLNISIESSTVEQGKPFVLTVSADDTLPNDALDLSPLFGLSFVIGNTEYTPIPADKKNPAQTQWKTTLLHDQAGRYTIPALTIDNVSSQPLTVTITPPVAPSAESPLPTPEPEPVITLDQAVLSTRLSKPIAYPDEAIYLDVDLELASELLDGVLSTPEISGGTLRQIGQDRAWSLMRDGNRYQIISRRYQITATDTENVTIGSIRFRGTVRGSSLRQPPLNSYAESLPVILNIKALPKDLRNNWLPAEKITLEETWFPQPSAAKVGEPLTRTIRLRARGLGNKPLVMPAIDYPNEISLHAQPVEQRRTLNDETELEIRHILMPKRTAVVTLPEITISWWNTQSEKAENAVLAAQPLNISINPALSQPVVPMVKPKENYANILGYLALFAALLTGGFIYWHMSQKRNLRNELSKLSLMMPSEPEPEEKAWQELEYALNQHDPAQITRAFSQWARLRWPGKKFTHFAELPNGDAIDRELTKLKRSTDNPNNKGNTSAWDSTPLRQLLYRIRGIRRADAPPATQTSAHKTRKHDDYPQINFKIE
ncbi:MAG: BatD family protein [Plesiomonas sp.]|uniref:BatD family protein n=1 Tax=Plesiomonas sp. TaxID=2486279 RepID=UPI003F3A741B